MSKMQSIAKYGQISCISPVTETTLITLQTIADYSTLSKMQTIANYSTLSKMQTIAKSNFSIVKIPKKTSPIAALLSSSYLFCGPWFHNK